MHSFPSACPHQGSHIQRLEKGNHGHRCIHPHLECVGTGRFFWIYFFHSVAYFTLNKSKVKSRSQTADRRKGTICDFPHCLLIPFDGYFPYGGGGEKRGCQDKQPQIACQRIIGGKKLRHCTAASQCLSADYRRQEAPSLYCRQPVPTRTQRLLSGKPNIFLSAGSLLPRVLSLSWAAHVPAILR